MHASGSLISAFSASSSMGVRVQYTSFRFLENAEIRPAGGRKEVKICNHIKFGSFQI